MRTPTGGGAESHSWLSDATYFRLRGWLPIPLYAGMLLTLDPVPPASWELAAGLATVACGVMLRAAARMVMGRGSDTRKLHASRLVRTGIYAWTRNPIYLGNVAVASGIAVLAGSGWYAPLLAALLGAHYYRVVLGEERVLAQTFGDSYEAYRREVPRLLPRVRVRLPMDRLRPLRRELRMVGLAAGASLVVIALRLLPWGT
jgi:protein-S-isoprenylcysteine O-methyltransferase Ste14